MAEFVDYDVNLGTFNEAGKFTWKTIKRFNDRAKAYEFYKNYVKKQNDYSPEELLKIWNSPRVDIELKAGKKILNWVGIYNSEVAEVDEEDENTEDSVEHLDMMDK